MQIDFFVDGRTFVHPVQQIRGFSVKNAMPSAVDKNGCFVIYYVRAGGTNVLSCLHPERRGESAVTENEEKYFAEMAESYDVTAAAAAAGIDLAAARRLLLTEGSRSEIDRRVARRMAGETLYRIAQAYCEMAFTDDAAGKTADRIRAMEALREMAVTAGGANAGGGAPLTIEYGYV